MNRLPLQLACAAAVALGTGCGGTGSSSGASASGGTLLVALNLPSSADPYVAGYLMRGARLAVSEVNAAGLTIGGARYTLALRTYDDAADPARGRSNVEAAIHDGAVGIIEDGAGAAASAASSAAAGVPEMIISDGTSTLLTNRPSLFRLGIRNEAAASVLGGYIGKKARTLAILHDDSADGRDQAEQLTASLATAGAAVAVAKEAPRSAPAVDAELRAIADAHPQAIAIFGTDTFTARVVAAAHADGLAIPLYGGQSAESPTVRQVAGADAAEGLTFIASRMTSEADASSFGQFEKRIAVANGGPIDAGFKDREGREIRQPSDLEVFSYDSVRVLAAALVKNGSASPGKGLLEAMSNASVTSAQGDHRGFNPENHEGLADDDVYLAVIHDMQFVPVKDEPLSATLPVPDELLANFH